MSEAIRRALPTAQGNGPSQSKGKLAQFKGKLAQFFSDLWEPRINCIMVWIQIVVCLGDWVYFVFRTVEEDTYYWIIIVNMVLSGFYYSLLVWISFEFRDTFFPGTCLLLLSKMIASATAYIYQNNEELTKPFFLITTHPVTAIPWMNILLTTYLGACLCSHWAEFRKVSKPPTGTTTGTKNTLTQDEGMWANGLSFFMWWFTAFAIMGERDIRQAGRVDQPILYMVFAGLIGGSFLSWLYSVIMMRTTQTDGQINQNIQEKVTTYKWATIKEKFPTAGKAKTDDEVQQALDTRERFRLGCDVGEHLCSLNGERWCMCCDESGESSGITHHTYLCILIPFNLIRSGCLAYSVMVTYGHYHGTVLTPDSVTNQAQIFFANLTIPLLLIYVSVFPLTCILMWRWNGRENKNKISRWFSWISKLPFLVTYAVMVEQSEKDDWAPIAVPVMLIALTAQLAIDDLVISLVSRCVRMVYIGCLLGSYAIGIIVGLELDQMPPWIASHQTNCGFKDGEEECEEVWYPVVSIPGTSFVVYSIMMSVLVLLWVMNILKKYIQDCIRKKKKDERTVQKTTIEMRVRSRSPEAESKV